VLELGCGPGRLWLENLDRIPPAWVITLSDFSPGMIEEAQGNLAGAGRPFAFERVDVQSIPFADASFDMVIANHMLYHVPDRPRALAEIRRVLRPGGRFYAATIGAAHLREIGELVRRFTSQTIWDLSATGNFELENGAEQLAHFFTTVDLYRYQDGLIVTEAQPLIDYILSGRVGAALEGDQAIELAAYIGREFAAHGTMAITKDTGLFEAT
jgi:ubiquinone/menaquinone biosynthesis C-methylase UbiE